MGFGKKLGSELQFGGSFLIDCEHEPCSGGHSVSDFQMGCEHELSSGYPRFAHASAALNFKGASMCAESSSEDSAGDSEL